MRAYADLELGLHRRDVDSYGVELRFNALDSDADVRLVRGDPLPVRFDTERLAVLALEDAAYGQLLSQSLFAHPAVRTAFAQARSTAQALEVPHDRPQQSPGRGSRLPPLRPPAGTRFTDSDGTVWAIHHDMVQRAQDHRAELLKATVSAATCLLEALKGL